MKSLRVMFPGGKRVDAHFDGFVVHTDQPIEHGGEGSAPEPFMLFLASLASCAGYYVLAFCHARDLSTKDVHVDLVADSEPTGRLSRVQLHVDLPPTFPEKYVDGVRRAAESCKVKKALLDPPVIEVGAKLRAQD